MRNMEVRNLSGGKVMQCLTCNQQVVVVYFEEANGGMQEEG